MFGRKKTYFGVHFTEQVLDEVVRKFEETTKENETDTFRYYADYGDQDDETSVKNPDLTYLHRCFSSENFKFAGYNNSGRSGIRVSRIRHMYFVTAEDFPTLDKADEIINIFERNYRSSKVSSREALKDVTVFIGHGRSRSWRDLKDHLQDHHGINVIAYESGQRAGYTIQEVLHDLTSRASLALLVHTGEDIDADGLAHARENVIHETGLLQGKLGFKRAIILLEDGTNEFSNIAGLQQLRFSKNNIKEVFGDVLAILKREFTDRS